MGHHDSIELYSVLHNVLLYSPYLNTLTYDWHLGEKRRLHRLHMGRWFGLFYLLTQVRAVSIGCANIRWGFFLPHVVRLARCVVRRTV